MRSPRWPDDLLTGLLLVGLVALAVAEGVVFRHALQGGPWR